MRTRGRGKWKEEGGGRRSTVMRQQRTNKKNRLGRTELKKTEHKRKDEKKKFKKTKKKGSICGPPSTKTTQRHTREKEKYFLITALRTFLTIHYTSL